MMSVFNIMDDLLSFALGPDLMVLEGGSVLSFPLMNIFFV